MLKSPDIIRYYAPVLSNVQTAYNRIEFALERDYVRGQKMAVPIVGGLTVSEQNQLKDMCGPEWTITFGAKDSYAGMNHYAIIRATDEVKKK